MRSPAAIAVTGRTFRQRGRGLMTASGEKRMERFRLAIRRKQTFIQLECDGGYASQLPL